MSTSRRMLPVLLTGTFMGFLDLFLVIVAVPSIAAELHASVASAQLVLTVYVVAYGATLVVGGRLGDRFGRRRVFAAGVAGFTLASAGCAVAPTLTTLVVVRGLQGIAGAAMLPQVLATIQAVLDGAPRRRAVLVYTTTLGAAGAFGQLIGGALISADVLGLGWRALFVINLPIGLVALLCIPRAVPETTAPEPAPIDVPGAVLLGLSVGLVLLGLGTGSAHGWPSWCWAMLAGGVAIGGLLIPVERRRTGPLLPGRLLTQRPVRWGLVATAGFYTANNAVFVGLTLFLQQGLGLGPLAAGAAYLPIGLVYMASTVAGRSSRAPTGPRALGLGAATMAGALAITILAVLLGAGPLAIALVLGSFGLGLGVVYPAIVTTVLHQVRPGDEGAATGVLLTATQVANALGIAVVTAEWSSLAGVLSITDRLAVGLATAAVLATVVAGCGWVLGERRRERGDRESITAPAL